MVAMGGSRLCVGDLRDGCLATKAVTLCIGVLGRTEKLDELRRRGQRRGTAARSAGKG